MGMAIVEAALVSGGRCWFCGESESELSCCSIIAVVVVVGTFSRFD